MVSKFPTWSSPPVAAPQGECQKPWCLSSSSPEKLSIICSAVIVEWNAADKPGHKGTAAMWDVHIRIGGFAGSDISVSNCLKQTDHDTKPCIGAFLGLHITEKATAYLEGTWVWTADHDLEDQEQRQIDVYTGRGILSESKNGPVWFIGTASEHASIVQVMSFTRPPLWTSLLTNLLAWVNACSTLSITPRTSMRVLSKPRRLTTSQMYVRLALHPTR